MHTPSVLSLLSSVFQYASCKNLSYCYLKFYTTNFRSSLLFCCSFSSVICFKMYNPKNPNFCHSVFRTTNPWLRLPTHNYFLEFCVSKYIIQKPWLLLLIFHITNPRPLPLPRYSLYCYPFQDI